MDGEEETQPAADDQGRNPSPTKPNVPLSASSLTPPPADDMDVDADQTPAPPAPAADAPAGAAPTTAAASTTASDVAAAGGDDWDTYRRSRGVRGFGSSKPIVKTEPVELTPAVVDASSQPEAPKDATPPAASEERSNSRPPKEPSVTDEGAAPEKGEVARAARRRRGEEQLLLDDHLLPKEMRVHGQMAPRREKPPSKRSEPVEEPPAPKEAPPEEEEEEEEEEAAAEVVGDGEELDDDDDDDGKDITRCVCKRDDIDVMMIQCDKCNVWQHGACMGIWGDEEAPDEYFCEECRPELHAPLRKWIRSRGRNAANFVAPEPADLQRLHNANDKHPPSQSKRWADVEVVEPPPPPVKPPSRSHHRKEAASPVDDTDRRPSRRAPPPNRERSGTGPKEGTSRDRRRGAPNRRVSADVSMSTSPPPGSRSEPRKRSTMNSRDAAYEEALNASLEASRREMSAGDREDSADDRKRRRAEEEDADETKKATKKKREEEGASQQLSLHPLTTSEAAELPPPAPPKPKHPNQYTYRPKPNISSTVTPSPARRGASTPQPTAPPPAHDHGTRRAGAIASNLAATPYTAASVNNLSWYLPDHLAVHSDLLPSMTPIPLEVPTPRNLQHLPRSHFVSQKYGPFSDLRDESGKLALPDDCPLRETEDEATTHREPPTRVRYPVKRVTVAEMRKRVRHVLEYVGRVQVEEGKRAERAKRLGISPASSNKGKDKAAAAPATVDSDTSGAEGDKAPGEAPGTSAAEPPPPSPPAPLSAAQLLDELTRDLIAFQEAFHTGDFESLCFVKPILAMLESSPEPPAAGSGEPMNAKDGDGGTGGRPSSSSPRSGPSPRDRSDWHGVSGSGANNGVMSSRGRSSDAATLAAESTEARGAHVAV